MVSLIHLVCVFLLFVEFFLIFFFFFFFFLVLENSALHDNAESHHHHLHHVHHHLHHLHHLDDTAHSDSRNGSLNVLPDSNVVDADDDDDDKDDKDDDEDDDDVDNDDDDDIANRDNGVDDDDDDDGDDATTGSSLDDSGDDLDDQQDSASPLAYFAGWLRGSRIGRGAFGEVYMGLNVDTGALFAEKVIELDYYDGHASVGSGVLSSSVGSNGDLNGGHSLGRHRSRLNGALEGVEEQIAEARREIDLMRQLTHEHIVQYLGTKLTRHELSIYLEYISGGSILALLKRFGPFPARLACNYTRQTLLGLAYLHERNVIHRDIKSANLLVTEKGCVKLADFGCSKNMLSTLSLGARRRSMAAGDDVNETAMRGTPNFLAPEVITRSQFPAAVGRVVARRNSARNADGPRAIRIGPRRKHCHGAVPHRRADGAAARRVPTAARRQSGPRRLSRLLLCNRSVAASNRGGACGFFG
jgi:hypothetical protein